MYKACVCSMLMCGNLGNESRGVFQRLRATKRRMLGIMCEVTLKDKVESRVTALRVGVDDLVGHLKQK